MFVLDLVFYYKQSRSVQLLKEISVSYLPADIYSDVKKSCIALFLGEVMTSVLKEESPHAELYDFIEDSVRYFDNSRTGFSNFHIAFLIGLSSYLGFEPGVRTNDDNKYFDLLNGTFVPRVPSHADFADVETSDILAGFFLSSYDKTGNIPLTGKQRNQVLETLLRYYSIHLPGLKKIQSLEVLKEIFG
jgi:DNA repair protein RecO (recombination protein O)